MSSELRNPNQLAQAEASQVKVNGEPAASNAPQPDWRPWLLFGEPISEWLAHLPNGVTDFFPANKRPLLLIALILVALVTVKITMELLEAIENIPLLASLFELIGLGYTSWFVYRYLITPARRQELSQEMDSWRESILGTDNSESG